MSLSLHAKKRLPEKSGKWENMGSDWMAHERGRFRGAGSILFLDLGSGFSICDNYAFLFCGLIFMCAIL